MSFYELNTTTRRKGRGLPSRVPTEQPARPTSSRDLTAGTNNGIRMYSTSRRGLLLYTHWPHNLALYALVVHAVWGSLPEKSKHLRKRHQKTRNETHGDTPHIYIHGGGGEARSQSISSDRRYRIGYCCVRAENTLGEGGRGRERDTHIQERSIKDKQDYGT